MTYDYTKDWTRKVDPKNNGFHLTHKKTGHTISALKNPESGNYELKHNGKLISSHSDPAKAMRATSAYFQRYASKPSRHVSVDMPSSPKLKSELSKANPSKSYLITKDGKPFAHVTDSDSLRGHHILKSYVHPSELTDIIGESVHELGQKGYEVKSHEPKSDKIEKAKFEEGKSPSRKQAIRYKRARGAERAEEKSNVHQPSLLNTSGKKDKKRWGPAHSGKPDLVNWATGKKNEQSKKGVIKYHKKKIKDIKAVKPNLPKSEITKSELISIEEKMELSTLIDEAKKLIKHLEENPDEVEKLEKAGIKGVHQPVESERHSKGVSHAGLDVRTARATKIPSKRFDVKGHHEKVMAEQKAMPKPKLPKSELSKAYDLKNKTKHLASKAKKVAGTAGKLLASAVMPLGLQTEKAHKIARVERQKQMKDKIASKLPKSEMEKAEPLMKPHDYFKKKLAKCGETKVMAKDDGSLKEKLLSTSKFHSGNAKVRTSLQSKGVHADPNNTGMSETRRLNDHVKPTLPSKHQNKIPSKKEAHQKVLSEIRSIKPNLPKSELSKAKVDEGKSPSEKVQARSDRHLRVGDIGKQTKSLKGIAQAAILPSVFWPNQKGIVDHDKGKVKAPKIKPNLPKSEMEKSSDAVGKKISKLVHEGKPQKQAVATALSMERAHRLTPSGGYKRVKKSEMMKALNETADLIKNFKGAKSKNAKVTESPEEGKKVKLYNTTVLHHHPSGHITLDSGGWHTDTTRRHINGHLPNGVKVATHKGSWHVHDTEGGKHPFHDGMKIRENGKPISREEQDAMDE